MCARCPCEVLVTSTVSAVPSVRIRNPVLVLMVLELLWGRASLVVGTHSHVPTGDAQILPRGTAYQTDAGACADYASVIGFDPRGVGQINPLGFQHMQVAPFSFDFAVD